MVRHWWKAGRVARATSAVEADNSEEQSHNKERAERAKVLTEAAHWKKSIVVNGVGAAATLVVLVVLVITKFLHGAWIVVVLIPLLVGLFRSIHRHYVEVATQLTTEGLEKLRPIGHEVIVPVSGIHRGVLRALQYAKTIAPEHVTALYINVDDEATQKLREKWSTWVNGVELVVIASPYRSLVGPLSRFVDRRVKAHPDQMVTVVLPEFVPARWWHHLLHNQSSLMLKGALLFKPNVIVTSVPYHLKTGMEARNGNGRVS
jgi:hypothetical protein